MTRKSLASLAALIALTVGAALAFQGHVVPQHPTDVRALSLFHPTKFRDHLRAPRDESIEQILTEEGVLLPGASAGQVDAAVDAFKRAWVERNPTVVAPDKAARLLARERELAAAARGGVPRAKATPAPPPIQSLIVPVEFAGSDTFLYSAPQTGGGCVNVQTTTSGPLHNQIAAPGPRDNITVYYPDATPALYEELFFGQGPDAGLVLQHPNLGTVDLRGLTMVNYYLEQSGGAFMPAGSVYPKWVQAAHSEGWYGTDDCATGSRYLRAKDLVREVVDLVKADQPAFRWQDYDADGDGIVDNFTVVHAGQGQEAGGGVQGTFALWSHASLLNWPTGYLACVGGTAGCPDRDVYVREYSLDPENLDLGVISEEYGHAAFGLPDLYTTDNENSIGDWSIMSGGSWNGPLAGMHPAPFPLFFRELLDWSTPVDVAYDGPPTVVKVGQHSVTPKGTKPGIKIALPDNERTTPNAAGTGNGWWSGAEALKSATLTRTLDLHGVTAPIFSFTSAWDIENGWDYGYVEVSTDGGTTWTSRADMYGVLTTANPNGQNAGYGLTGSAGGTLQFDLAPYAGLTVLVRLRYVTDLSIQNPGWWADDFRLQNGATTVFTDDVESGANGWSTDGWSFVPLVTHFPRYYLAEWRNASGFDAGLKYAYQSVWSDVDEWEVDRAPYSVPGMLLWYRDALYGFDYVLNDSLDDPPSRGPKYGLLVVDSHPFPYGWNSYHYASGAPVRLASRVQPADATFALQPTTPFTLRLGVDPATGQYVATPLATESFGPRPAVSQFHDSVGWYPGWYYPGSGSTVYSWLSGASAVLPALDRYTTRITGLDQLPYTGLYGYTVGPSTLGSGNPGDDGVQFGVHAAVLKQDKKGKYAKIVVWSSPALVRVSMKAKAAIAAGKKLTYTVTVENLTPAPQRYELACDVPAHTTFVKGKGYDAGYGTVRASGIVKKKARASFTVLVDAGLVPGTTITANAAATDDAQGASGGITTTIE